MLHICVSLFFVLVSHRMVFALNERTVQVLLDHGADIDLAERANGRKALHLAVNTSNVLCVHALLEHMKKEQEGVVVLFLVLWLFL